MFYEGVHAKDSLCLKRLSLNAKYVMEGTGEEEHCKHQQIILTVVDGVVEELEMFRNLNVLHVLNATLGFYKNARSNHQGNLVKWFIVEVAGVDAWIPMAVTSLRKKENVVNIMESFMSTLKE